MALLLAMLLLVTGPTSATLTFDGTDDVVDYGNLTQFSGATAVTVMLWLRIDNEDGSGIWGRQVGNAGFWTRMLGDNTAAGHDVVYNTGIVAAQSVGSRLPAGTFYHDTIVFNGAGTGNAQRHQQYINGVLDATGFTGTVPALLPSVTASFFIGRNANAFGAVTVAHVRVWLAALSAEEISHEMHAYRPRRTENLLIWSPFDDEALARDYSGSGKHGTLTGALPLLQGPPVSGQ